MKVLLAGQDITSYVDEMSLDIAGHHPELYVLKRNRNQADRNRKPMSPLFAESNEQKKQDRDSQSRENRLLSLLLLHRMAEHATSPRTSISGWLSIGRSH